MSELTALEWEQFVAEEPAAHILQTAAWGDLKSAFGWRVRRVSHDDCGAQILFRQLPLGFSLAYIAKGPLGSTQQWQNLWSEIDALCRKERSVLLIVEPDLWQGDFSGRNQPIPRGFRCGVRNIQPLRTIVVDLLAGEAEILARMKQKTRYNIRLASKRGIRVTTSSDIELFHRLMIETGVRDQFGVHSQAYYQLAYDLFNPAGNCEIFLADYQGKPVAALMVFSYKKRAWYFYGASSNEYREYMPTYLLQWEAIRWAKAIGCQEYDLWGVPDFEESALEGEFNNRSDGLWGVYRFKRGFGGQLRRSVDPWERVYNPVIYALYRWWTSRRSVE
jgi:lipid II:glycine glycyltransferase (peptidoglycan interpeptide bridge formation enzyme)